MSTPDVPVCPGLPPTEPLPSIPSDVKEHQRYENDLNQKSELHYPPAADAKYDFRLDYWDRKDYDILFRSLYPTKLGDSRMAGKHFSVTKIVNPEQSSWAMGAACRRDGRHCTPA